MKSAFYKRRWFKILAGFAVIMIVLVALRYPILRMTGNHLIQIDEPTTCQAIFVLGGNSKDRATYAATLYHKEFTPLLVCSGGNIPSVLEAIDTTLYESEISVSLANQLGVPQSALIALKGSTSTFEESIEIRKYCEENELTRVAVLSSMMHTKRVRNVFEEAFDDSEIEVLIFGAPSTRYDETQWWNSEEGMIMVNNEYMKLMYYFIKH